MCRAEHSASGVRVSHTVTRPNLLQLEGGYDVKWKVTAADGGRNTKTKNKGTEDAKTLCFRKKIV